MTVNIDEIRRQLREMRTMPGKLNDAYYHQAVVPLTEQEARDYGFFEDADSIEDALAARFDGEPPDQEE